MTNFHTFSTCCVDVIFATVFLAHGHLLQLTGDVVRGAAIDVPVGVDAVGAISSSGHFFILRRLIIVLIKAVPAVLGRVPRLPTDLASDCVGARPAVGGAAIAPAPVVGVGGPTAAAVACGVVAAVASAAVALALAVPRRASMT